MGEAKIKKDQEVWPKEIPLTVAERLILYNLLPKEGGITSLRILRELREDIALTEKELEKYEVKEFENGNISINPKWFKKENAEKTLKAFNFGPKAWDIVKDTLVKLSVQKKLPIQCIDMYDKFGGPQEPA